MKESDLAEDTSSIHGRQRLIDAALALAARNGKALLSLGIRELAREAELNHNTFYRHFSSLDELAQAAAEQVASQIMTKMKDIRLQASTRADATEGATAFYLDFVQANTGLIVVGLRELHSLESPMRGVLQAMLSSIARESSKQVRLLGVVADDAESTLFACTLSISYYMFYRALDVIEDPAKRPLVHQEIVQFIRTQFVGRKIFKSN
ncbi:MAG: TetR/AcrR family transcriptional regulator [Moraxellaceae bacterium]|nr:TetR/AcrR family transcriptional regulator [Moraxellaceae bacterium]MDP1776768.1 TetR/AcrR family transcriptional regulator [Moraxellaceae bacterium]MDZ4298610.1 TetR/AcrR family transcriptional regulator [Moraxellaceae bacterium]MDZ4385881.1 TetR/AcrR family transcriptional regulator [Moraxellaceae bacterium]